MRSSERNTRSSRSIISARVINPRSAALTVDSSCSPTFVGEVRRATTGSGSSWKLSGASQCVSSVTNFSKNAQCSFAYLIAACRSLSLRRISPRIAGALSANAMLGLASHTRISGRVASTNRNRWADDAAGRIVRCQIIITPITMESAATGHIFRHVSSCDPTPSARGF